MKKRATEDTLGDLHGLVADNLSAQIRKHKKDGEAIPPQLYAQAIKFLKDNGIDAPRSLGGELDTLAGELENVEFDDEKVVKIK